MDWAEKRKALMGKVFKALSRSESEQPSRALAAVVIAEEEEAQHEHTVYEPDEPFDFVRFSLDGPGTGDFDSPPNIADKARRANISPAREVTLDVGRIDPHLVAFYDFDPRAAEAYSKMAVTMISAAADQPLRRVLIASAQHGEGRTSVTLNLAAALAQAKQRVLVVDTDFQRPSLLRLLGIEADAGIAEAVTRRLSVSAATLKIASHGFNILPLRERVGSSAASL